DTETTAAADARIRAYTLFVRAYDACRRAICYLRWAEGDVDTIVPTLIVRRTRRAAATDAPPPHDAPSPAQNPAEAVPAPTPPAPGGEWRVSRARRRCVPSALRRRRLHRNRGAALASARRGAAPRHGERAEGRGGGPRRAADARKAPRGHQIRAAASPHDGDRA